MQHNTRSCFQPVQSKCITVYSYHDILNRIIKQRCFFNSIWASQFLLRRRYYTQITVGKENAWKIYELLSSKSDHWSQELSIMRTAATAIQFQPSEVDEKNDKTLKFSFVLCINMSDFITSVSRLCDFAFWWGHFT